MGPIQFLTGHLWTGYILPVSPSCNQDMWPWKEDFAAGARGGMSVRQKAGLLQIQSSNLYPHIHFKRSWRPWAVSYWVELTVSPSFSLFRENSRERALRLPSLGSVDVSRPSYWTWNSGAVGKAGPSLSCVSHRCRDPEERRG